MAKNKKKIIIMGAAGRDFHNFNTLYRDNNDIEVVAFTATQIPDIDGRAYPKVLAGKNYPKGIPIVYVMAAGARFAVEGGAPTMIKSTKPVVAVCAIRTGCGKSQTTRRVAEVLQSLGKKVVAIRHPMPYGDLSKQIWQRFAKLSDLDKHKCTIEEREEYEPHIMNGVVVYAGVDYEKILREAEKEADVILWDGGNNDMSFYKADLQITVVDPHRPGHELSYYPGQVNLLLADVVVINKIDSADPEGVAEVRANIADYNPNAIVVDAMPYGAGVVAAEKYGAAELVDPRPFTVKSITATYEKYPGIGVLLPAMGYGNQQVKDLETTINRTKCDSVVIATPIDLGRIIKIKKPSVRVEYSLQEIGTPDLSQVLTEFVDGKKQTTKKRTTKK